MCTVIMWNHWIDDGLLQDSGCLECHPQTMLLIQPDEIRKSAHRPGIVPARFSSAMFCILYNPA